jgi:prepilin signal peptidase PulO-like enzyme (type II secretory pathway)
VSVVWAAIWAIAGLVIGSAIWALADKQIRGALVTTLRPVCLSCGGGMPMRRWLPLTWLTGDAACPTCGESDSRSRRTWEVAVAAYFVLALAVFDAELTAPRLVIASLPLLLILAVDLKVQAVFVQDCYVAIVVGLFLGLTEGASEAANAMAGMGIALVVTAFFLLITRWLYRSLNVRTSPIGLTDIFVAAAMGSLVRADALLPALVAAVLLAAGYGIITPVLRPGSRSRLAPLGPFLCIGGLIALSL